MEQPTLEGMPEGEIQHSLPLVDVIPVSLADPNQLEFDLSVSAGE